MIERIADRVAALHQRVARACRDVDRDPRDVMIVAVAKTHPPEAIREAIAAGMHDIGENRVNELRTKQAQVDGARWHLVGRLQRNKVRDVIGRVELVHSVDRPELAAELDRRASAAGLVQRVLIQVNVGDDPRKGGCQVGETLDLVAYAHTLRSLMVEGLMTVPPLVAGEDAATSARSYFATLRALRDEVGTQFPQVRHLSMGMTADLEAAIDQGATIVRCGTAVFGPRHGGPWRPPEGAR